MQTQDDGNAKRKFDMLGFMAEGVHTQKRANTATDESDANKGLFRNSPLLFDGFFLINEHKQEANGIDYTKIKEKIFHT